MIAIAARCSNNTLIYLYHAGKLFWIQHDYFVINHSQNEHGNPQTTSVFLRLAV
jgi:hypothetical protein